MTQTYRATVSVELEITAALPLTEDVVREVAARVVELRIGPGVDNRVVAVGSREEPVVSIAEAWCAAIARRNTVDGQLYACQMSRDSEIHGSIETCAAERDGGCAKPDDHHDYVSPGWDSPIAAPAAVPA